MASKKKQQIVVTGGLQKSPPDNRDFSFGAAFPYPKLVEIPDTYLLNPLLIRNQLSSDYCTSMALCGVSELQERTPLDPAYQFYKTKQIMGDPHSWGADLRSAAKSATKHGSLPASMTPYPFDTASRDEIVLGSKWSTSHDDMAKEHKKQAYFFIDHTVMGYDIFDSIRAAMWQFRKEQRAVLTGTVWHSNWTDETWITEAHNPSFGHALAIIGWIKKDGVEYVAIQNSYGEDMGDKGIQYFSREMINQQFTFGNIMFADMPAPKAVIRFNSRRLKEGWLSALLKEAKSALGALGAFLMVVLKQWS